MLEGKAFRRRLGLLLRGLSGRAIVRALMPVIAVGVALLGGGIVIALSGVNPLVAYRELFKGAFGSTYSLGEILVRATPLGFTGLAFAVASRGGLTNIGAEGQLYAGALGATLVALLLPHLPPYVLVPLTLLAACAFGGIWGAIPGILKARWNVNEFVNTVMMNYIALYLVNQVVSGPLRETPRGEFPQTNMFVKAAWMPILVPGTRLTVGIILLLFLAVGIYVLLWKTAWGYQVRVMGHNPRAALYAGMNSARIMVLNLALAGALAGMGGAIEVTGVLHRLMIDFSPGYGYTGITVALLGRKHPFGVIVAALFFGVLRIGGRAMESYSRVSFYVIRIMEALLLLAILSSDFVGRRLLEPRAR